MDIGEPISYEALDSGTPVFSSDGEQIGTVAHVLAAEDLDVFDGIVISEHLGPGGHKFVDADQIDRIGEHGVVLRIGQAEARDLPKPSENPAVVGEDPGDRRTGKLRRAWDLISGNY
jgi:uncharacterized protein YrrD